MKIRPGARSGDLNRTDLQPYLRLAHVCSSLPRFSSPRWPPLGPGPGPWLGKLEHTFAKPRYGRKSVRFRSPDPSPGRIFMKRTRGIRFFGSRGRWEPNWGILSWGGGGPMYAIVYPEHSPLARAGPTPPTHNSQIWLQTAPGPQTSDSSCPFQPNSIRGEVGGPHRTDLRP